MGWALQSRRDPTTRATRTWSSSTCSLSESNKSTGAGPIRARVQVDAKHAAGRVEVGYRPGVEQQIGLVRYFRGQADEQRVEEVGYLQAE